MNPRADLRADTRRKATRALRASAVLLSLAAFPAAAQDAAAPDAADAAAPPARERVLYCVGYAHLDTQWRWDYATTIDEYLRATLDDNFERFQAHPEYVFNFTGSRRYMLMQEYFPERFERLARYVAQGRWHVSGSSVDECDANSPSAESILRQVLYGNEYFRRTFDRESADYMLPDCFGFPASLPSILHHCGILGFSTQKLAWGSAVGIPFPLGRWVGPDGAGVVAALDPGPYAGAIEGRVDRNEAWAERIRTNGERYGVWADFHYYGVGDVGGAPRAEDVANYVASIDNEDSLFHVELCSSDRLFRDLDPADAARLPRYEGDLLLTQHSAGSLTSQAAMKRWNRKNEVLADAAERAAVAADWLGAADYPRERLNRSWIELLGSQMHDMLPGTCVPFAYDLAWNDELVALNGFAAVVQDSASAVARGLDTRVLGVPLVVCNPLSVARTDPLEARVRFDGTPPEAVRVVGPDGAEVPVQVLAREADALSLLLLPSVPALSWSVYDVQAGAPEALPAALSVDERSLENESYRVRIDANGDLASVLDKRGGRELLAAPARLVLTPETPQQWPAWNMDWDDRQKPPIGAFGAPLRARVVERGPVRVALELERTEGNSTVTQTLRLARGDAGRRLELATRVDWQSAECALRASFPLVAASPEATYNLGLGTIRRGNNDPKKYEVPSHEWLDLTDASGAFGVSLLEDCKTASDKPSDGELRLTLLFTPGVRKGYQDQHSQDWGRHELVYGLYAHEGDWRAGTHWQARRLNAPLLGFQDARHAGALGRRLALCATSSEQVELRALKLAERSDDVIVRLQELEGRATRGLAVSFAAPVVAAWEVDGQERAIGPARVEEGRLVTDLGAYQPRSFALRLAAPAARVPGVESAPVALPFDRDVASRDAAPADGAFDATGRSLPAEMLPDALVSGGVRFVLGSTEDGRSNAVACRGQTIALPEGAYDRVRLLAAADEAVEATFRVGAREQTLSVQPWTGFVGQWDKRLWDRPFERVDYYGEGHVVGFEPGFVLRDPIAWFATHRHAPERGNETYRFSYLFDYGLDLPQGARTLTLPDDPRVKILAASVASGGPGVRPTAPLYDDLDGRGPLALRHVYPPPPRPVHEGVAPVARAEVERAESFAALALGPPPSAPGEEVFRAFLGDGEYPPHPASGMDAEGRLPRLADGVVAQDSDDTARCVWYDNEGRFWADLGRSQTLAGVCTWSWHRANRAPQAFSLWGSNAPELPAPGFQHGAPEAWTLLAVVDTRPLGQGGVHASAVVPREGEATLGPFRWLLWVAEDLGEGTFFTEIDVVPAD